MNAKATNKTFLKFAILSLSLLTVMAGAAMAPALGVIQEYFSDDNPTLVQMIISVPAIFIIITNFIFPKLAEKFGTRSLTMIGLILYTVGGCISGLFNSIYIVLLTRAFVGIGVGIIMPLSTGLLGRFFPPEEQDRLMGYSSAMNQMGGVVATLISGMLAVISWRLSFLVYLLGLISIVLVLLFLPQVSLAPTRSDKPDPHKANESPLKTFGKYNIFIIAMFLLMTTFFFYPTNFAIEVTSDGVIPQNLISIIMAGMDFTAFIGGLAFVSCKRALGPACKMLAPVLFLLGYVFLFFVPGWFGIIAGSVCVGFANGVGIPYIISTASRKAGMLAVTTVIPLISAALYLGQFLSPLIKSAIASFMPAEMSHIPWLLGVIFAALFLLWSIRIKEN